MEIQRSNRCRWVVTRWAVAQLVHISNKQDTQPQQHWLLANSGHQQQQLQQQQQQLQQQQQQLQQQQQQQFQPLPLHQPNLRPTQPQGERRPGPRAPQRNANLLRQSSQPIPASATRRPSQPLARHMSTQPGVPLLHGSAADTSPNRMVQAGGGQAGGGSSPESSGMQGRQTQPSPQQPPQGSRVSPPSRKKVAFVDSAPQTLESATSAGQANGFAKSASAGARTLKKAATATAGGGDLDVNIGGGPDGEGGGGRVLRGDGGRTGVRRAAVMDVSAQPAAGGGMRALLKNMSPSRLSDYSDHSG